MCRYTAYLVAVSLIHAPGPLEQCSVKLPALLVVLAQMDGYVKMLSWGYDARSFSFKKINSTFLKYIKKQAK